MTRRASSDERRLSDFGQLLNAHLVKKGLSVRGFAEMCNSSYHTRLKDESRRAAKPMSNGWISAVMRGDKLPSEDNLAEWVEVLGLTGSARVAFMLEGLKARSALPVQKIIAEWIALNPDLPSSVFDDDVPCLCTLLYTMKN